MNEELINQNGNTIATNFGELGLQVKFVSGTSSPLGETYLYDLVYVSQFNKNYLKSLITKIAVYHHKDIDLIDTKEAHFGLFVHKNQSTMLSLYQCMRECNERDIVIGKDNYNNLVKLDFSSIPHLLVAGTTGSGKSVLLHNLLVNLLCHYKDKLQLVIIDPKGTELNMYRSVRNTTFVDNTLRSINVLQQLENIMDTRYKNGNHYNHEIFIVIDELADLMLTSKYEVEQSLIRIAQKGRACGMHLIVATQRPSCDVVSGLIKANLPYRICLKTASVRDSVVIMDKKGSETLDVGEAIVKLGVKEIRTKIAMCESAVEDNFIRANH